MTRTLVTGATGFVGAHVVDSLRARGHEVVAIGRNRPGRDVAFIEADLLDQESRRRAVDAAAAERLIHVAWIADIGVYWRSPLNLDWVAASLDLVKRFREGGGARAVVVGSCAEYEWGSPRFDETATPCRPATLYGTAKDATRRILTRYADECGGLALAWARLYYMYGPGEKRGRLVSDAIDALRGGRPFPTSEGRQRRDFLHVADVADALVALLDSAAAGAVNVASGRAVAVRDLLGELAAQLGNERCLEFGARPTPASDPEIIEADVRRLTTEVGFVPRFDLAAGLADTIGRAP